MNRPFAALAILLAAALLAGAADPAALVWRADLSTTEVRNLYLRHGDSASLTARLYLRGEPYSPTNAVCFYQTNGMGRVWWSLPCSIASNTVTAAWTPLSDRGAAFNPVLFRIDDAAYRAAAILHLRASPGPEPDAETFVLDFGTIAYTNAPWATRAAAVAASAEAICEAVTVLDSGHVDTVAEIRDTLLELIEQLKRINQPQPGEYAP